MSRTSERPLQDALPFKESQSSPLSTGSNAHRESLHTLAIVRESPHQPPCLPSKGPCCSHRTRSGARPRSTGRCGGPDLSRAPSCSQGKKTPRALQEGGAGITGKAASPGGGGGRESQQGCWGRSSRAAGRQLLAPLCPQPERHWSQRASARA